MSGGSEGDEGAHGPPAGEAAERAALARLLESLERAFPAPTRPPDPAPARGPKAAQGPNHHHARALLLALGEGLHELGAAALGEDLLARARDLIGRSPRAWGEAVEREMELAGWEYDQSVDPRFLGQPDYDLEYTLGARDRLELRLLALDPLGLEPPRGLLEKIDRADRRLEQGLGRAPRGRGARDGPEPSS